MNLKFPIVILEDSHGCFTVSTASGVSGSAYGPDLNKCKEQLKRFVSWEHESGDLTREPEFSVPNIDFYPVPVRTGYQLEDSFFPSENRNTIRIPVVWGYRDDDLIVCHLPSLNSNFYVRHHDLIPKLISGQVQDRLNGISPMQFSRFYCPVSLSVDTLNVRIRNKRVHSTVSKNTVLESVAERYARREHKSMFPQAWYRDVEVERLNRRISGSRSNLILLGNHGVGKTTLLVNAIRRLEKTEESQSDDVESGESLQPAAGRFWFTTAERLIAGMQYLGEWEERVEQAIEELASIQGVLCFENLEQLIRVGGSDPSSSISAFLIPFLQNNELRLIVEADRRELDACRQWMPGIESLFEVFEVPDFSPDQSRSVLHAIGKQYTQNQKISFDPESADLCIRLFRRYHPYASFPGKCVQFWHDLFDEKSTDSESGPKIAVDDVVTRFIRETGLPEELIRDEFIITAEEIRSHLKSRIIGQPEACDAVTNVVTTLKAGLNDPARPIGVQLFCGPTGVGKTEMAKALANYLFGAGERGDHNADRLVRLDMSEYSGLGAAEKLVMQPNGEPSKLVQQIREQPFVVLLLDEIEKAAPEVFDVLMGVFDEGRLTDRWGRTTDFRSTVIIMTSNLGVRRSSPIGFENESTDVYENEIRRFFRPEFFNRFDRLVVFRPLAEDSIRAIADLELQNIEKRTGFAQRSLRLSWDESVVNLLVKKGFDKRLGARPLQRTIESLIVSPIAELISESPALSDRSLSLSVSDGTVRVDIAPIE